MPVKHRGSCCLYYRFDPDARAHSADDEQPDAHHRAYLERFGDDAPPHCGTCLFRAPEDGEARMIFNAEYERAAGR